MRRHAKDTKTPIDAVSYDALVKSPMADRSTSLEEAAIWCDMHAFTTSGLAGTLDSIAENFHTRCDCSIGYGSQSIGSTHRLKPSYNYAVNGYYSDAILANLFIVISKTDSLDKCVLDKAFLKYAKDKCSLYKEKIRAHLKTSSRRVGFKTSHGIESSLYEVFAELVDIVEYKLTKTS